MATMEKAYDLLLNGSMIPAANEAYSYSIGVYFWPIFFIFTLVMIAIKTENPAYIAFYAIIGNIVLGQFLPIATHPIFYTIIVLSLAIVLWSIYASKKAE